LFEKFPVDQVYGMHNWPGMPVGEFAVRPGPMMAAFDLFEITVRGKGAHGAMPHQGVDPGVVAAQIVAGRPTMPSRNTKPRQIAVVSVTQIHGGDTFNVIPDEVVLGGTTRSFKQEIQDLVEANLRRIAESTAAAYGASVGVRYERRYPPTVNSEAETELAAAVLGEVVGTDKVHRDALPSMGGEDFAFMLQKRPGSYIWIGNGETASLHNSRYDFNDEILPLGASYWARL